MDGLPMDFAWEIREQEIGSDLIWFDWIKGYDSLYTSNTQTHTHTHTHTQIHINRYHKQKPRQIVVMIITSGEA